MRVDVVEPGLENRGEKTLAVVGHAPDRIGLDQFDIRFPPHQPPLHTDESDRYLGRRGFRHLETVEVDAVTAGGKDLALDALLPRLGEHHARRERLTAEGRDDPDLASGDRRVGLELPFVGDRHDEMPGLAEDLFQRPFLPRLGEHVPRRQRSTILGEEHQMLSRRHVGEERIPGDEKGHQRPQGNDGPKPENPFPPFDAARRREHDAHGNVLLNWPS